MTGPEHYREAEEDLAAMAGKTPAGVQALLMRAQVHAMLALAAATAFNCDCVAGEWEGWVEVAASDQTKQDRL